jgi:hypothetical protein
MRCDLMCIATKRSIREKTNIKTKEMQIVNWILLYCTIGILMCLLVDYAYMRKEQGSLRFQQMPNVEFTTADRIATMLLWPLGVFMALRMFVKQTFK